MFVACRGKDVNCQQAVPPAAVRAAPRMSWRPGRGRGSGPGGRGLAAGAHGAGATQDPSVGSPCLPFTPTSAGHLASAPQGTRKTSPKPRCLSETPLSRSPHGPPLLFTISLLCSWASFLLWVFQRDTLDRGVSFNIAPGISQMPPHTHTRNPPLWLCWLPKSSPWAVQTKPAGNKGFPCPPSPKLLPSSFPLSAGSSFPFSTSPSPMSVGLMLAALLTYPIIWEKETTHTLVRIINRSIASFSPGYLFSVT